MAGYIQDVLNIILTIATIAGVVVGIKNSKK